MPIKPTVHVDSKALSDLQDALDSYKDKTLSTTIKDIAGRSALVSQTGELHVASKMDDITINFQYGISTRDIKNGGDVSGTGAVGGIKSTAFVSTGTGIGSANMTSKDAVRYKAGHEVQGALSVIFPTPEVNVKSYAGFLNDNDAWAVGYQDEVFGIWFIEGGNVNFIPQSTWNLDRLDGTYDPTNPLSDPTFNRSAYTINPQGANIYRLSYSWHGFLPMFLEVYVRDIREWVPCHVFEVTNTATETHLENPNLPISMKIERTVGTGPDLVMQTGSWRAGSISGPRKDNASNRWFSHTELDFPLVNDRNNVFTLRNKTTYNSKINHIIVELGIVTFDSLANKTVAVYGTSNATIVGAGAYADVDTINSVMEFAVGGTITGGTQGPATVIRQNGSRRTDVRGTGIRIYPGESFTFEVDPLGAVNGTFSVSARFVEYH